MMDLVMPRKILPQTVTSGTLKLQVVVPVDTFRRLKVVAAATGKTVREVITELVEANLPPVPEQLIKKQN